MLRSGDLVEFVPINGCLLGLVSRNHASVGQLHGISSDMEKVRNMSQCMRKLAKDAGLTMQKVRNRKSKTPAKATYKVE